jgi:hypothetical protein
MFDLLQEKPDSQRRIIFALVAGIVIVGLLALGGYSYYRSQPTEINLPIHGNKSSRIYHLQHCPNYADVSPQNLIEFKTEADALSAGFRKAKNCEMFNQK